MATLPEKLLVFISEHLLFSKNNRLLLALSGGVDSVVMVHLLKELNYEIAIAHCNFKLRGRDSDEDENFCRDYARSLDIPFFVKHFDTKQVALDTGISIQMAARDLRYNWFDQLCKEEGFDYVLTGHQLNDSLETFLVNFSRGCGIRGLHGIPVKNGNRVRPLLFATRAEIESYASEHQLAFRTDASNEETKYLRNKLRHEIVPRLKEINPLFEKSAFATTKRILEAEQLYDFAVEYFKKQVCTESGVHKTIDLERLRKAPGSITLLYELLKTEGLHVDQAQMILNSSTGAVFQSTTHRFLVNRDSLVVEPIPEPSESVEYTINKGEHLVIFDLGELLISNKQGTRDMFPQTKRLAFVDESKLEFPLTIRNWKSGDVFQPLGMQGKTKKLKDYFTDIKLSLFEKEKARILVNNDGKIIWVMGYRLDDRFKIGPATSSYLELILNAK